MEEVPHSTGLTALPDTGKLIKTLIKAGGPRFLRSYHAYFRDCTSVSIGLCPSDAFISLYRNGDVSRIHIKILQQLFYMQIHNISTTAIFHINPRLAQCILINGFGAECDYRCFYQI